MEVEVQVFFHYYERVIQTKIVKLYKIFTYTNCVYNKNNNRWVNSKLFITLSVYNISCLEIDFNLLISSLHLTLDWTTTKAATTKSPQCTLDRFRINY
jgi:hypothetical protein